LWTFRPSGCLHRRENGGEHLKMAVSLEFWHFHPTA
jgi:hypothetical protein